ncbi:MAG TPA: discoidin domain-containing protein, partial [Solirubrobacteraceae bacterium]
WGGTVDAILPRLARTPVAVRYAVPYEDLRAADLEWTTDALVQQRRALPGQVGPLLDLLGAGVVVAGTDDDRVLSGAVAPADAADVLDQLGPPQRAWGPVTPAARTAGTLGPPRRLPQVRAWDRPGARPLVRVEPDAPATVVDGSASGLAGLAAFGPLNGRLVYAADASAAAIRAARDVVITDSNRRQVFAAAQMEQNHGATVAAGEGFSPDAAVLDPFPRAGAAGQTVAVLSGAAYLRAPYSPAFPQFPERRPLAAFDGDPGTFWQADRNLGDDRHWVEIGFTAPRDVDHVDLLPYSDARGRVTAVEIAGRHYAVRPDGWTRLALHLHGVRSLRVRIAGLVKPPAPVRAGAGGIRELRIPGVRVRDALRPPVLAERALAGRDLRHTGLTYLFERTTGDDPFRRDPAIGTAGALDTRDRGDGESGLARVFAPPAARAWTADGWVTVAAHAPDSALDALAGARGARWGSSGRFQGRPGWRASSAADGTARPWIGFWLPGRPTWLQWTTRRPRTVRALRLVPAREPVRRPTLVRLRVPGAVTAPLAVAADGRVRLSVPLRARRFRLEILRATRAPDIRAVGIAEIAGAPRARVPRSGRLRTPCGVLRGTLGGRPLRLRVTGTLTDLDAGRPLRARGCGAPLRLSAGPTRLEMPAGANGPARLAPPATTGVFAPYLLRLRSAAPAPVATAAAPPGRVLDPGRASDDGRSGIRLDMRAPGWLVLGQAYSAAWRARCDGRALGAPVPVDGFAMGWRVPAGCRNADVYFAPDRIVRAGYVISGLALLLALALLVLRRPPPVPPPLGPLPAADTPARLPARRAAVAAVLAGLALGFAFAARGTPLFALAVFLVLRYGIGVRALVLAAGALLAIVVPILTLTPGGDRGGFDPDFAAERIAAHWVAVAAVTLLVLALVRALSTARAGPAAAPAHEPRASDEPAPAP